MSSLLEKSGNVSTQPPAGLSEAALAQHAQTQGANPGKRASVTEQLNNTGQKQPNKKGKPDISLIDQASTNVRRSLNSSASTYRCMAVCGMSTIT